MNGRKDFVGVCNVTVLFLLLLAIWFWGISVFAKWRWRYLGGRQTRQSDVLSDWAVQLFLKGTGLLLRGLVFLSSQWYS